MRTLTRSRHVVLFAAFAVLAGFAGAQVASGAGLDARTFVNHGLVGVGRVPHNFKDKFGETFGSFSALAFAPGSWHREADGSYTGTLLGQPDRGYNASYTTNYTPRLNKLAVRFQPATADDTAQNQVSLTLTDTIKYTDSTGTPLTSLDPTASGSAVRAGFPALPQAFNGRISLDAEGIAVNADGTLWVSDEYGPYLYKFSAEGKMLAAIRPPEAIIPKRNGADSFAANSPGKGQPAPSPIDPATGRQNNQGIEGLGLSPDGHTLFALLQSATRQDGGEGSSSPRGNTRLLAYDLSGAVPVLKGEYILPLPTHPQKNTVRVAAQSDLLVLSNTQMLVLARDSGVGHGTELASVYRHVLVYDLGGATNIAGTAFDQPGTPVAPGGVLDASVKPATRTELVDLNNAAQLARFGLHNGPPDNANNLSEKWEGMALVPALDAAAPNDWFLFIGNDNDFLTTQGFQAGETYNAGVDNDTMVLVYRLTLPGR